MTGYKYASIAGIPGHRCGQCRFFASIPDPEALRDPRTLCLLIPPGPGQDHAKTAPYLFCPAWEPADGGVKDGCVVDLSGHPFVRTCKPSPSREAAIVAILRSGPLPGKFANALDCFEIPVLDPILGHFSYTIPIAQAVLYHASTCPCRKAT